MNAAIFRFFFTLAPDPRRLAREKRNEKQRKKSLLMEAFFVI
ncbi:pheST operon leader peptide PheM [Salmonella enterica]|nr:pheST operon leader peptide PheM [Salmonella enterica]